MINSLYLSLSIQKGKKKKRKKNFEFQYFFLRPRLPLLFLLEKSCRFISRCELENGLVIAGHFDGGGSVCIKKPSIRPNLRAIRFYSVAFSSPLFYFFLLGPGLLLLLLPHSFISVVGTILTQVP